MCGIAGILNLDERSVDPHLLDEMVRMLNHRGPDESGVFAEREIGLANARLSVIDLETGQQPMTHEDAGLSITFNGEIYNYIELREELEAGGHTFRTRSDTEVLLHLYEAHGDRCVERLNGQFAFAVWDARKKSLFLSRDRLGIRPLYYATVGRQLVFASEIKALFVHPEVERCLDPQALDQIFTYWVTLPPRTLFRGVSELAPGHSMRYEDGESRQWRYWSIDFGAVENVSLDAAASELAARLDDASRIRLRSNVPVGAYLSGGLDSTAIIALSQRHLQSELRTFSVSFESEEFDESVEQESVARSLGTRHEVVRCTDSDVADHFQDVVWRTEQPLLRTAPVPLYLLSRHVHACGFKVVLAGEGADELFGGYNIFKEAKIRRFCAAQPDSELRPRLLRRLYPYLGELSKQPEAYLRAFFRASPDDLGDPFFSHRPRWKTTKGAKRFFSSAFQDGLDGTDDDEELLSLLPEGFSGWDHFSRAQCLETMTFLPGYLLSSQGDRVAMAHSVEGRFPFLDHRVVEFAARMSPRLKMPGIREKRLLKHAMRDVVPPRVLKRNKFPFRAPGVKCFLGKRRENEYVSEFLSEQSLKKSGIFAPSMVHSLVEKIHRSRTLSARDEMAFLGILSTQILVDRFTESFNKSLPHV